MAKSCCSGVCPKSAKPSLRFQYGINKKKEWYWHIRGKNGEIIAEGEGYKRVKSVTHVWALLATGASTMDITAIKISAPRKRRG